MEDNEKRTLERLRYLMDGNGTPGIASRVDRLEEGHTRQAQAIKRLEAYAQQNQRNTAELLGGWKVGRWFLIVFTPLAIGFAWWVAGKLQAIS